jgi:hypothetical protein
VQIARISSQDKKKKEEEEDKQWRDKNLSVEKNKGTVEAGEKAADRSNWE